MQKNTVDSAVFENSSVKCAVGTHATARHLIRKLAFLQELISAVAVQEQLLRELDMYQEIAVARTGLEYDTLNVKMDHCQESIETLSDEIQRLRGEQSLWTTK